MGWHADLPYEKMKVFLYDVFLAADDSDGDNKKIHLIVKASMY